MDYVAVLFGGPHDGQAIPCAALVGGNPPTQIDLAGTGAAADDPHPAPVYHRSHEAGPRTVYGEPAAGTPGAIPGMWYIYEPIWLRRGSRRATTEETQ